MKYLKVLGLAAFAAMAIMAFGAGTASAVKLCANGTADGNCGANKKEYSGNISGETSGVRSATLTTNVTTVHCDSTVTLNAPTSTGTPLNGSVTALAFNNCQTSGGTACEVTVKNLPYSASLTSATSLTVTDEVGAGALVKCGFLINCEFTTKEAKLTVTSGNPTLVTATGVKLNRAGGFCPETSEWDASYKATAPAGLTVL